MALTLKIYKKEEHRSDGEALLQAMRFVGSSLLEILEKLGVTKDMELDEILNRLNNSEQVLKEIARAQAKEERAKIAAYLSQPGREDFKLPEKELQGMEDANFDAALKDLKERVEKITAFCE